MSHPSADKQHSTPLQAFISSKPRIAQEVVPFMGRVLRAVADVHARKERHADLTPAIIQVDQQGAVWVPSLPGATSDQGTRALPEPRYAAPELLQPALSDSPETTEERTDLYVLGMIFYELLAGTDLCRKEFEQILHSGNPAFAWYDWHCNPTAEVRALGSLLPDIPESLARTIQRMMAKNPADRWRTIAEVLDQLNRVELLMARQSDRDVTTLVLSGRSTHRGGANRAKAQGSDTSQEADHPSVVGRRDWLWWLVAFVAVFALLLTAWCRFAEPLLSADVEARQEEVAYVR